ncbi:type VI secretion system protein TssA [Pseudorhodoferax sp.]|uniref:type VI secretion system protein TssA n=1 Tax=Pseudorhodoferax sp. TaxID=1993553 RepID=UPI0039E3BEC0
MNTDLAPLLRPFDADAPCGPDMSFSAEFDALRELRREDDATLKQGDWKTALKRADWPGVLQACETLLGERSKDLRVAGWYTEAAARLRGYAGLADGLDLYAGLVDGAWNDVHPQAEDGDQEQRIGSIQWLLALVGSACRRVAVLRHEDAGFTLADLDAARQRALAPEGSAQAEGYPNMDDILRVQRQAPVADVVAALAGARRAAAALNGLQQAVDARLGDDGPGFVATREAVADAVAELERLVREMGGRTDAAPPPSTAGKPAAPEAPAAAGGTFAGGAPATRAQALAQLREVAEFFRRTEPHSPVAYLVERAAAWGDMPLHAWLRHVMKDGTTLAQLEELLGIAPPDDGSSGS